MKTNKKKIWIGCGILCVLSVLLSSWYAVAYNDSRLVVPMDFKDYVFDIKDLPMIVSVSLTRAYLVALFVMLFIHAGKKQRQDTGAAGRKSRCAPENNFLFLNDRIHASQGFYYHEQKSARCNISRTFACYTM